MPRFTEIYEMGRPLIVWLALGELAWIGFWLFDSGDTTPGYRATAGVWLALMLAWMPLVIYLGNRGVFLKQTRWLSNLAGFALVLVLPAALFGAIDAAREGLVLAASHTSNLQLVSFHVLRLLAIGTVIKYAQGQLPLHFVLLGSVPDLLFAVSAVVVTLLQVSAPLGQDFLIAWHIVGFFVFFGAGISMFFSVPSPFRIYRGEPDASLVFQFPMLLAPNFTVPLFALAHAFALVKLLTSQ
jgi:hypothetical protein